MQFTLNVDAPDVDTDDEQFVVQRLRDVANRIEHGERDGAYQDVDHDYVTTWTVNES